MMEELLPREPVLRLVSFFGVFAIMALWEVLAARRVLSQRRRTRWIANLGLSAVDTLVVRLVFPAATVGLAVFADRAGWGLLGRVDLPIFASVVVSVVLLDLAVYLQHVMFHAVPALWRLHLVHHADQDLDFTTGVRFHPIEILLSALVKFAAVAALGPPPEAVLLFEVLLNASSMFNHGNVRLPAAVDRMLRWVVVTPDMHRVHHSVEVPESNSNFGFNLPWWDRLFGTYRPQPGAGHEGMRLGVGPLLRAEPRGLLALLALPFAADPGRNVLGKRDAPSR